MMQRIILLLLSFFLLQSAGAQLKVSPNGRYLVKPDGTPFFWMGDTAWELFHRLNREQAAYYLKRRSEQGFTVVQAVALAEFDGLHTPNVYGDLPLKFDDPTQPNEAYFKHVDSLLELCSQMNMVVMAAPLYLGC